MKIGFDNDKYLAMQSEHIRERIKKFDNKLYLEFGGKLFDDYHASRVLPGFQPDSKLQMLLQLKEQAEIVIVISAEAITPIPTRKESFLLYLQRSAVPPQPITLPSSATTTKTSPKMSIFISGRLNLFAIAMFAKNTGVNIIYPIISERRSI